MVWSILSLLIFSFQSWSTDHLTNEAGYRLEVLLEYIGIVGQLVAEVEALALLLDLGQLVQREEDFVL
jgi:hypothetical protein